MGSFAFYLLFHVLIFGSRLLPSGDKVQYVSWRKLRIPCKWETKGAAPVVGLKLYCTRDNGSSWNGFPAEGLFEPGEFIVFEAPEDGNYGFWLSAVDAAGHSSIAPRPGDEPKLRVVVDTKEPEIDILSPSESEGFYSGQVVLLKWVVRDANLGELPLQIFYNRGDDISDIPIQPEKNSYPEKGELSWALPLQEGRISFVFVATDLAGNKTRKKCGPFQIRPYLARFGPKEVIGETLSRHLFIPIFYRFPKIDPGSIGSVEVWYFQLDRPESAEWKLAGTDQDRSSPYIFKAPTDGRYALRLTVKGKDGRTYLRPLLSPQEADLITVVDTHDPQVEITSINGVRGEEVWIEGGKEIEIEVLARDRNLERNSLKLQYSLDEGASWHTLAEGLDIKSDRPFKFKWTLPKITCPNFLIRASVRDQVGRTGQGTYSAQIHIRDRQSEARIDAKALLNRGELALSLGTPQGLKTALKLLRTAVGFAPKDPRAREALARALLTAGKRKEALIHLRKAVELLPSEVSYRLELVEQLIQEGKATGEEKLFEEAKSQLKQVKIEQLYLRSDFALLREKYRACKEALSAWAETLAERLEKEK